MDRPDALACPVCGEPIEILTPFGEVSEAQIIAATEQVVLMHVQVQHTMHEVLAALGTARNALMDIRDSLQRCAPAYTHVSEQACITLAQMIDRGLAGQ